MIKPIRIPSLTALATLIQVADSGNFTTAGKKLFLTQSAVSRQVQLLEEHYGCRLLQRNSHGVSLSPEGELVVQCARRMLSDLTQLEEKLHVRSAAFRIRMHVSLALRWFLPRLPAFYRLYPDSQLTIETVATDQVGIDTGVDACIAYVADLSDPDAPAPVIRERLIPVCSPDLRSGKKGLRSLKDLSRFTLLHRSDNHEDWHEWLAAHGVTDLGDYKHLTFNLDELVLDAAIRGLGVAMTDATLALDAIQRGELVVPFGQPLTTGGGYVLQIAPHAMAHKILPEVVAWIESSSAL